MFPKDYQKALQNASLETLPKVTATKVEEKPVINGEIVHDVEDILKEKSTDKTKYGKNSEYCIQSILKIRISFPTIHSILS